MKVLIEMLSGRESNEYIIEQCEKALPGYREDENGDLYWFEADGEELVQVYDDEDKTIRWTIHDVRISAAGAKTEVELVC